MSNARGMPGGGMLKLRFDRYINPLICHNELYLVKRIDDSKTRKCIRYYLKQNPIRNYCFNCIFGLLYASAESVVAIKFADKSMQERLYFRFSTKGPIIKYRGGGWAMKMFFFKYWFSVAHPQVI